jgi:hypothetical protein
MIDIFAPGRKPSWTHFCSDGTPYTSDQDGKFTVVNPAHQAELLAAGCNTGAFIHCPAKGLSGLPLSL